MVTSVGAGNDRYALTGFLTGQTVTVHCIEPVSGLAGDARIAIALIEKGRPNQRAAFAAPDAPLGAQPTPGHTYSSSGGAVTQTWLSTGLYDVTFARLGAAGAAGHEGVQ